VVETTSCLSLNDEKLWKAKNSSPTNTKTCKHIKTAPYRPVTREFEHDERVMEKKHRVEVLRALLEMHQGQHDPDDAYSRACGNG